MPSRVRAPVTWGLLLSIPAAAIGILRLLFAFLAVSGSWVWLVEPGALLVTLASYLAAGILGSTRGKATVGPTLAGLIVGLVGGAVAGVAEIVAIAIRPATYSRLTGSPILGSDQFVAFATAGVFAQIVLYALVGGAVGSLGGWIAQLRRGPGTV